LNLLLKEMIKPIPFLLLGANLLWVVLFCTYALVVGRRFTKLMTKLRIPLPENISMFFPDILARANLYSWYIIFDGPIRKNSYYSKRIHKFSFRQSATRFELVFSIILNLSLLTAFSLFLLIFVFRA